MFERFTDRARRVLVLAQEEARILEHDFIGTEHVLLGLLGEGEGVAATVLGAFGVEIDAVRLGVEEVIGLGAGAAGSPPFTPRAKKVLELSLREALQLQHSYIGTEHILLGLIREGEGVACKVLIDLGIDLAHLRLNVIEALSGTTDAPSGVDSHPGRMEGRVVMGRGAGGRWLREVDVTTGPSSDLLRRYVAGEASEEELADDGVTKALASELLHIEDLLRTLIRRGLP
jgi:ATP-dependent Clp protease ATP-binding subunit ClpA